MCQIEARGDAEIAAAPALVECLFYGVNYNRSTGKRERIPLEDAIRAWKKECDLQRER